MLRVGLLGVWPFAAEVSLLFAFQLAGGPTLKRLSSVGVVQLDSVVLYCGPVVGKARADFTDPEDEQFVHLC